MQAEVPWLNFFFQILQVNEKRREGMHSFLSDMKAQTFKTSLIKDMKTLSFKMKKEERECTRSLWMWNHSGKEQKCTHSGMNVKAHFCTNELKHWCKMRIEWKRTRKCILWMRKQNNVLIFVFQNGEQNRVVKCALLQDRRKILWVHYKKVVSHKVLCLIWW